MASGLPGWGLTNGPDWGYVLVLNGSADRLTEDGYRQLYAPTIIDVLDPRHFGWALRQREPWMRLARFC